MDRDLELDLDPVELRVLGSLIEKELTTPQAYPLSLLAVVAACGQTSNRDPVMEVAETEAEAALTRLRRRGLTRVVHPTHGRGVVKYRQVTDEVLALEPEERAVLAVLLLRGPQTPGELRARADRLADLATLDDAERAVDRLVDHDPPLAVRLERRPGQKEGRVAHLLGGPVADDPSAGARWTAPAPPAAVARAPRGAGAEDRGSAADDVDTGTDPHVAALHDEVAALRATVDELRRELAAVRDDVGELRRDLGAS